MSSKMTSHLAARSRAVTGALAGLTLAALHESGVWSPGPDSTLWPIGAIVLVAGLGLIPAFQLGARESWSLGTMLMIPNLAVVLFYGFLLLFFGLGGSR